METQNEQNRKGTKPKADQDTGGGWQEVAIETGFLILQGILAGAAGAFGSHMYKVATSSGTSSEALASRADNVVGFTARKTVNA